METVPAPVSEIGLCNPLTQQVKGKKVIRTDGRVQYPMEIWSPELPVGAL